MNILSAIIMRVLGLSALGVASVIGYNYLVGPEKGIEVNIDIQNKSEPTLRSQYEAQQKEAEDQARAHLEQIEKIRKEQELEQENMKKEQLKKSSPAEIAEYTKVCEKEYEDTYKERTDAYFKYINDNCGPGKSDDLYCMYNLQNNNPTKFKSFLDKDIYVNACVSGKVNAS